jgi:hypothetical protein
MFATLLKKKGGLPVEKVAKLISVPSVDGGLKRQLVKPKGDELGVGAAFCGRSVILPLMGPNEVTSALAASAREIAEALIGAAGEVDGQRDVFYTPEAVMHITLFATAEDLPAGESPAEETLAQELCALKKLAEAWDPFTLECDSVVVMPSGTILLLCVPVPETGTDAETTRREFEAVCERDFPLASGGVPNIFHCSLGRVCFGVTLTDEEIANLARGHLRQGDRRGKRQAAGARAAVVRDR